MVCSRCLRHQPSELQVEKSPSFLATFHGGTPPFGQSHSESDSESTLSSVRQLYNKNGFLKFSPLSFYVFPLSFGVLSLTDRNETLPTVTEIKSYTVKPDSTQDVSLVLLTDLHLPFSPSLLPLPFPALFLPSLCSPCVLPSILEGAGPPSYFLRSFSAVTDRWSGTTQR